MSLSRSWQFIGPVGSPWYRVYDWARRGVNGRLAAFLGSHVQPLTTKATPTKQSRRVWGLEAGSGTAFASSLMAKRTETLTSVCMDIDIEALVQAKKRDARLFTVVGDLRQMPFADGSFRLVFNSSTVEHLSEPLNAVREMERVCEASGRVFVGVPYAWGPLAFQPVIGSTTLGVWLGRVFTKASLDRVLQTAGLTPIAHVRYFWNFFIGAVATKRATRSDPAAHEEVPC